MNNPQIRYDPEVDALYIQINDTQGLESEEIADGIVIDYDQDNNIVGIEILGLSRTTY